MSGVVTGQERLRHRPRNSNDGSSQFAQDGTFCPVAGNSGSNWSLQSVNYTNQYIRHYDYTVYIAGNGGSDA
jgi:non-reducing end alpha-L-arabinofuranosidase